MFETLMVIAAVVMFFAVCAFGNWYTAREDARRQFISDDGLQIGWIPSKRDRAILRRTEREMRAAVPSK
ncbi:hypothetical protein [Galbitalea soli]|uniref:Uncharacterized protein n=1 Tax=Galbitalea soli TaxID=1268042 RepID=A0A7C9PMD5_9MICO|nr:hypothetical protein [Galbitalea soli]NEM90852.1 hypothetical protein [Galbitalea soli]NYJ31572.1 hypothetical protein [Galbitalea soli]